MTSHELPNRLAWGYTTYSWPALGTGPVIQPAVSVLAVTLPSVVLPVCQARRWHVVSVSHACTLPDLQVCHHHTPCTCSVCRKKGRGEPMSYKVVGD